MSHRLKYIKTYIIKEEVKGLGIYIFIFILLQGWVYGNQRINPYDLGVPFITNFSYEDYGALPQNWSIIQDHRGVMYFANTGGVLEFDGSEWRLIGGEDNLVVKSLGLGKDNRIYVGTLGDLGYLATDLQGKIQFISLLSQIPKEDRKFLDIDRILVNSKGIYFVQRKNKIFRYHKNKFTTLPVPLETEYGWNIHDRLVVHRENGKLGEIKGDQFIPLAHCEELVQKDARLLCTPMEKGKMLVISRQKGLYTYNFLRQSLQPIPSEVQNYIYQHNPFSMVKINHQQIAVGTQTGGIVIMTTGGDLIRIMDRDLGITNDAVYCLFMDQAHNLWAGTESGISFIEVNSQISRYNQNSGLDSYVLNTIKHKGIRYAGTMQNLFYLPPEGGTAAHYNQKFIPLGDTLPYTYSFLKYREHLLVGGYKGVYQIQGTKIRKLCSMDFALFLGMSHQFPNHIFIGSYPGFFAMKLSEKGGNLKMESLQTFKEIHVPVERITPDKKGDLWLTSQYKGLLHIRFSNSDISQYHIQRYLQEDGLPTSDYNWPYSIKGEMIIATTTGIYKGIPTTNGTYRFEPENTFGKYFNESALGTKEIIYDKSRNHFWIMSYTGIGDLTQDAPGIWSWNPMPYRQITVTRDDTFFRDSEGVLWHCSPSGLYRFDFTIQKDYHQSFPVLIRQVNFNRGAYRFHGTHPDMSSQSGSHFLKVSPLQSQIPTLPYKDNSVVFTFSTSFYEGLSKIEYCTQLTGAEGNWGDWTGKNQKEYTYLPAGEFVFKVKARNIFGTVGMEDHYAFKILPPWYQTILAYILYMVGTFGIFYLAVKWNSRRLVEAKKRLEDIVKQRTVELRRKNEELETAYQQLEISNTSLNEANSQLEVANQELERLATHDALTGISNQRRFYDFYEREWKTALRYNRDISIILVDIDYFKNYNDTYGHLEGDLCLKKVARAISRCINRPGDIVARYGGEEFIIFLYDTNIEGALNIGEKVRESVEQLSIPHTGSKVSDYITISVGVSSTRPDQVENSSTLIKSADQALYKSKDNGRNRVSS